jgi:hypothetical protein
MTGRTAADTSTAAASEETTPAAAAAAGRIMASRSTPGSTAAGTTAVITAGGAGTTATTTSSPLKEGRVVSLYSGSGCKYIKKTCFFYIKITLEMESGTVPLDQLQKLSSFFYLKRIRHYIVP